MAGVEENSEAGGHPIPFITLDNEGHAGKFSVSEEARQMISALDGPLSIISVVGQYRTGKSFLLNRILLGQNDGFVVGSTVNACTKGLWIWSEPVRAIASDGTPVNLLIIDTEGLNSTEAGTKHDCIIFALALLTSSLFLYNSVGTISESAIDTLSLVVEMTKYIRTSTSKEEDGTSFAQFFPKFMWIVRDFSLQLVNENGKRITSREYLENALLEAPGVSEKAANKNRIRAAIKGFFQQRDCYPLVRPVEDESMLQSLSSCSDEVLRPKFVMQMQDLRSKVMTSADPKKIRSGLVSGSMLVELAQSWVHAVNTGSVPDVEDTWTNVCQAECRKHVMSLHAKYLAQQQELRETLPLPDNELLVWHREAVERARKDFKKATGTLQEDMRAHALDSLEALLAKELENLHAQNEAMSKEQLHTLLEKYVSPIELALERGEYENWAGQKGFQEAKERARRAILDAHIRADSHAAQQLVTEHLERLTSKAAQRMLQLQLVAREESEAALQARISAVEAAKRDEVRRLEGELENVGLRASLVQEQQQQSEDRIADLREQVDTYRQELTVLRQTLREREAQHEKQDLETQVEVDRLRAAAVESERERGVVARAHSERMAQLEQDCEALRDRLRVMETEGQREREMTLEQAMRERARADSELVLRESERRELEEAIERDRAKWKAEVEMTRQEVRKVALAEAEEEFRRQQAQESEKQLRKSCEKQRERDQEWEREVEEWRLRVSAAEEKRDRECQLERDRYSASVKEQWKMCSSIAEVLGLEHVSAPAGGGSGVDEGDGKTRCSVDGEVWSRILEKAKAMRREHETGRQRLSAMDSQRKAVGMRQGRVTHLSQVLLELIQLCLNDAFDLVVTPPAPLLSSDISLQTGEGPAPQQSQVAALLRSEMDGAWKVTTASTQGQGHFDEALQLLRDKIQAQGTVNAGRGGQEVEAPEGDVLERIASQHAVSGDGVRKIEEVSDGEDQEDQDELVNSGGSVADVLQHELLHESVHECLEYCARHHGWDLRKFAQALELDIYGSIRFVNFLRRQVAECRAVNPSVSDSELLQALKKPFIECTRPAFLDDDAYLYPYLDDDELLGALGHECLGQAVATGQSCKQPCSRRGMQDQDGSILWGEVDRYGQSSGLEVIAAEVEEEEWSCSSDSASSASSCMSISPRLLAAHAPPTSSLKRRRRQGGEGAQRTEDTAMQGSDAKPARMMHKRVPDRESAPHSANRTSLEQGHGTPPSSHRKHLSLPPPSSTRANAIYDPSPSPFLTPETSCTWVDHRSTFTPVPSSRCSLASSETPHRRAAPVPSPPNPTPVSLHPGGHWCGHSMGKDRERERERGRQAGTNRMNMSYIATPTDSPIPRSGGSAGIFGAGGGNGQEDGQDATPMGDLLMSGDLSTAELESRLAALERTWQKATGGLPSESFPAHWSVASASEPAASVYSSPQYWGGGGEGLGSLLVTPALAAACKVTGVSMCLDTKGKSFTKYHLVVLLAHGGTLDVGRRYSDFVRLHSKLVRLFPHVSFPKVANYLFSNSGSWFNRFDPELIQRRQVWVEEYLMALIHMPECEKSEPFRRFLVSELPAGASVAPSRADTMPTATSIPHMPVSVDERAPSLGASSVAGSMVTVASRRSDVYESGHRSRGVR